jgi:hypothetical protein
MKIIKPHQMMDSMLVSSTVAENDYPAWVSGTTYAVGARVIRLSVHKVYERLVAGAGTVAPEVDAATPAVWLDVGPTKRWAPFDNVVGTLASGPSPLTYVLRTGFTDSLALFELSGRYVDVTMKDGAGGTVVYQNRIDLEVTDIETIFDWFFTELDLRTDVVITDLPGQYASAELTVSLTSTIGTVSVGVIKPGLISDLGETQAGASVGIDDYSRKERDEFGNTVILERAYSKKGSFTMLTTLGTFNRIYRTLAALRATPCVYIATEEVGYEPLLIYGFFSSFNIDITYPEYHLCSLDIEGLI